MQSAKDIEKRCPYALIVGGSSGIGLEMARQFLASEIDVAIVARRKPLLQTATEPAIIDAQYSGKLSRPTSPTHVLAPVLIHLGSTGTDVLP